ncbi:MAG: hypothetical protein ACC628_09355 [Pirellulaceae bacterium]
MDQATTVSQQALLTWAMSRSRETEITQAAMQLVREFGNPRGGLLKQGVELSRILYMRLQGICDVSDVVEGIPAEGLSERLLQWRQWTQELRTLWPVHSEQEWADLLAKSIAEENRVVLAVVSQSIAECIPAASGKTASSDGASVVMQYDRQWFLGLPVPPEVGRSYDRGAYFHWGGSADTAERITVLAERVAQFEETLRAAVRRVRSEKNAPAVDSSRLLRASAELAGAGRVYASLASNLEQGWPVESKRLVEAMGRLNDVLESLAANAPHDEAFAGAPSLVHEGKKALDALQGYLATSATHEDAGGGESDQENSSLSPEKLADRVARLSESLAQHDTMEENNLAAQLQNFAVSAAQIHSVTDADREQLAGKLLALLIAADGALYRHNTRPLSDLRDGLRDLLFTRGWGTDYVLLDKQLVGQPLAKWLKYVEVESTVSQSSFPSDCVDRVARPGYAYRGTDQETVLRKVMVVVVQ